VFLRAHWILYGSASGSWSASIGIDRKRNAICGSCHGRGRDNGGYLCYRCSGSGQLEKTETEWHSQSGVAKGILNGDVVPNIPESIEIKCGKRDYKAKESPLSTTEHSNIFVLQPKSMGDQAGQSLAKKMVEIETEQDGKYAARSLGHMRNYRAGYIQVESVDARAWLYPIYFATYQYEQEHLWVQLDGITGQVHIDVPKSVKNKRLLQWFIIFSVVGVVILILILLANQ
jgi:hypothetical protein